MKNKKLTIEFKKKKFNNSFYFFEKEHKIKSIVDYEFRNIHFSTNQSLKHLFKWNKINYSQSPSIHSPTKHPSHNISEYPFDNS